MSREREHTANHRQPHADRSSHEAALERRQISRLAPVWCLQRERRMTPLHASDLIAVTGGELEADPQPQPERFIDRELSRIQREQPFGATRDDAVREWNQRMDDYNRTINNPGRYYDWLSKQPIG